MCLKVFTSVLLLGLFLFTLPKTVFASVSSCKYYVLDPWDPSEAGVAQNSNLPISVSYGRASASNDITNVRVTHDQGNTIGSTNNGFDGYYTSKTYDANGVYIVAASSLNSHVTGTAEASVILNSNFSDTTTFQVEMSDDGGSNYTSCVRRDDSTVYHTSLLIEPPPPITIGMSPATSSVTVGTPFNVDVEVDGGTTAFNAAQATVTVSSNLAITGLHNPSSNACNFQYVEAPSTSDPSFAGALFNSSSTNCKAYTLTLTPQSSGTGTITFTDGSIKSFASAEEIMTDVVNGSYTISGATPTPTPTPVPNLTINTYPADTYSSTYLLSGTRDTAIIEVFVNGSSAGVSYPTSTTWEVTVNLSLGNNNFTVHGEDANNIPTATQYVTINRHTLGDINGDGLVNLTDASLFAVDWGKTSGLTYALSDMNGDGSVNLTDFSILAKLEE